LLGFGAAYYITLLYPDLPPAQILLGQVSLAYLALVNGLIYGIAALLIVSVLFWSR
jgi:hypothetical protein